MNQVADASPETTPETFDLAQRSQRLGAALLDGLICLPLLFLAVVYTDAFAQLLRHQSLEPRQTVLLSLWGYLSFIAINSYTLTKRGQTLGKCAVRIRITDLNSRVPPLWKTALLRYLPMQLFGLIRLLGLVDSLLIFRRDRRCLHDLVAGTRVVRCD